MWCLGLEKRNISDIRLRRKNVILMRMFRTGMRLSTKLMMWLVLCFGLSGISSGFLLLWLMI